MKLSNPYPKGSRLYKIKKNKSAMAAINRQNSQISADFSNSQSAFLSIESAASSVANDSFEADPGTKLQSLHDAATNIRIAMPQFKRQSRSNAVTYQRLKNENRNLDGRNAMLGAALAAEDNSAANATQSMQSSLKSQRSKISEQRMRSLNPFYHDSDI